MPYHKKQERDFSRKFLRHAQVHTKKGTARFYSGCMKRLLAFPSIATVTLDEVTGELAAEYADYRMDVAENEIETVNGDLRSLRRMMNLAVEWKELEKAPIIHEVPGAKGRDYVLSWVAEAQYLAASSANLRDAAILLLDTGVRPQSELMVLAWPNVELIAHPETPHGCIHIRWGKTDAARRSIPLTLRAADVLSRRKKENEAKRDGDRSQYVFPGVGNSGHIVSFQHQHKEAVEKANLDWFVLYSLRHTFGTRCAQSGMDKYSLARLMGHGSPQVASRYYVHVTESHAATGFQKFADYQARGMAEGMVAAFPDATAAVQ